MNLYNFKESPQNIEYYHLMRCLALSVGITIILFTRELSLIYFWTILSMPLFFIRKYRFSLTLAVLFVLCETYFLRQSIDLKNLFLIPLGIFIGHLSTMWIHNASHKNFKPKWLNLIIGELSAVLQISSGLAVFRYIHMAHHSFPDNDKEDPHPSKGFSLIKYIETARFLIAKWFFKDYTRRWGMTKASRNSWRKQSNYLNLSRILQIIFLILLFGPINFIYLCIPLYYTHIFFFFYFNYRAHKENKNGEVEILNLNDTIYCKFCNIFLAGSMFHLNHHKNPTVFNPRNIKNY